MTPRIRHAFTLIETIAVIVVVGVLAGVIVPVVAQSTTTFADMSEQRDRTEATSLALERIVRAFREAPDKTASAGVPDINTATSSRLKFTDGTEVRLSGTTLWFNEPGQTESPLCQNVSAFELTYLGADGLSLNISVSANWDLVQRINVRLACTGGAELRTSVFLRCTLGGS